MYAQHINQSELCIRAEQWLHAVYAGLATANLTSSYTYPWYCTLWLHFSSIVAKICGGMDLLL